MLDLMTLKVFPDPLVDVFYYDGPVDFLSLEGETILYLAARDRHRETGSVSWFAGAVTEQQVRLVLSGTFTKHRFVQKFCTHRVDSGRNGKFSVSVCVPEDYAPDFMCDPTYCYRWKPEDVDKALYDVRHGGEPSG